jgi:hypothetical protein
MAVASQQHANSHFLFQQGISNRKQHEGHHSPTHLPTFLFSQLKIKLKGRHFDMIEVNEAE